jgi:hypothetical protein
MLDDARLSIATIQNSDLGAHAARIDQALDFINHPRSFSAISGSLVDSHRFTVTCIGSKIFTKTLSIISNQMIGSIQDVSV